MMLHCATLRFLSAFKPLVLRTSQLTAISQVMADVGVAESKAASRSVSEVETTGAHLEEARMETVMALPRIVVRGKKVILLSGFKEDDKGTGEKREGVIVDAKDKLLLAAKRNPDAVAFGYIAGEWIASA
jgi:hypothetical protein